MADAENPETQEERERAEAQRRILEAGGWDALPEAPPPEERTKRKAKPKGPELGPVLLYGEALAEYLEEERRGDEGALDTGWPSIDGSLGKRIRPGEVVIAAARTGVGKTWVAQLLTERKLRADPECGAVDFTIEMAAYQMAERFTVGALGLSPRQVSQRAQAGMLNAEQIAESADYLKRIAFYEATTAIDTIPLVLARARERLGHHIGLIVVDYTQLLSWQGNPRATLYEQATVNMRRLKDVAKAERAVIVAAAQLSRGGGGAGDREPNMAALRDSGAAEEAADRILMFWRDPPATDEDGKRVQSEHHEIRCKLEKNRHGPTGQRCLLRYSHSMGLFEVNEYDDADSGQGSLGGDGDIPF